MLANGARLAANPLCGEFHPSDMFADNRFFALVAVILWLLCPLSSAADHTENPCGLRVERYGANGSYTVWRNDSVLIFKSGMTVDADGSPRAYHPDNVSGLDELRNAGRPGDWAALLTIDGAPVLQGPDDPAPSYFVSMTSLEDDSYPGTSPAHYVNAEEVPYIALPPDLVGPELGDVAYVLNTNKGMMSAAILADVSPVGKLGEGSIALASQIGINADARWGGIDHGVVFVVFLKSGEHNPLPVSEINLLAQKRWSTSNIDAVLQCLELK